MRSLSRAAFQVLHVGGNIRIVGKKPILMLGALSYFLFAGYLHADSTAEPYEIAYYPPDYPKSARMSRTEGYVRAELSFDIYGKIADYKIIESEPHGVFDAAAIKAISLWHAVPTCGTMFHQPFTTTNKIIFHLKGIQFSKGAPTITMKFPSRKLYKPELEATESNDSIRIGSMKSKSPCDT